MAAQLYTENYRKLRNADIRRNDLPKGKKEHAYLIPNGQS